MVKGVLTLFLFLTISIPLSAQYILQGVVTDSLTKEPLPYASVRLKDTTEGTVSYTHLTLPTLKRHDRRNYYRKRRTFLLQDQPFRSSAGSFSDRL